MYIGFFLNLFLIVLTFIAQTGFISGLPWFFSSANLALVCLVFILVFDEANLSLFWLALLGFLLESVSFLPFGSIIFPLSGAVFFAHLLMSSFFTNRSLYSLIFIVTLTTLVNEIILLFYNWFYNFFSGGYFFLTFNYFLWQKLLAQILLNSLLMVIIFYTVNLLNPKLKPFILNRR